MTPDERRHYLRRIIDQHNEAARAIREASADFKTSAAGLMQAYSHIEAVAEQIQAMTAAMLEANAAALALFNDEATPDDRP